MKLQWYGPTFAFSRSEWAAQMLRKPLHNRVFLDLSLQCRKRFLFKSTLRHVAAATLILANFPASPLFSQELIGPRLAVASNFSQSWRPDILEASARIPVTDFRDTVHWNVVEKEGKRFDYRGWRAAFPGILAARDREMSLFVNAFHPVYDNGDTAHTDMAVAAFGNYVRKTITQYPNIRSVEVGNEFNGDDFVRGPVRTQNMELRAAYYVALLAAVFRQVKEHDPAIRVSGGGVHSIPVAYLEKVFANGGGKYMDALAIHPYNTAAEHLVRQISVLRQLHEIAKMPIEVTEFGTKNSGAAPGFFLRNYCQMALAGVDRAVWYPMHPRGDGFEPVLDDNGNVTPLGQAYGFAQTEFSEQPARVFAPDAFTYGCLFANRKLVIWGEKRTLTIGEGIRAFDETGAAINSGTLTLSRNNPIVLISDEIIDVSREIVLSPQQTIADSFHQFDYEMADSKGSTWKNSFQTEKQSIDFETMPGQERQGVPWTPYLGHPDHLDLRLAGDFLVPTSRDGQSVSVVQSYTSDSIQSVEIDARWSVDQKSEDGISILIMLNDLALFEAIATDPVEINNRRVDLRAGDVLKFVIGPNKNPWGDYTTHRITLRKTKPDGMPVLGDLSEE